MRSTWHIKANSIAAVLLLFPTLSFASQAYLIVRTTASHDVIIKGYSRSNSKCQTIGFPPIFVERPPSHGVLCSIIAPGRAEPTVTPHGPNCTGRIKSALHIVYLPRAGFVGGDSTQYVVRFPEEAHAVDATIVVEPAPANSRDAVPRDITDPADDKPQEPGLLKPCSVPVS